MLETTCFVCDETVTEEGTNLASAVAPVSKVGLAEKISQVIGERYVIIITEKDVVCKRCVSLLTHMDKLENEFMLVKKALLGYIKRRYNLRIDDSSGGNIKKNDSNNEEEREACTVTSSKALTDLPVQNSGSATLSGLKNVSVRPKDTKIKPAAPDTGLTNRMKVYKCGFCSFQSKELNDVRVHMNQHVKVNNKIEDPLSTPKPVNSLAPPPPKRRLYKCQLCSASFDDKIKCLEHISNNHTQKRKAAETNILQKVTAEKELNIKKQSVEKDSTSAMETDMNPAPENPFDNSLMEYDASNTSGATGLAVVNSSGAGVSTAKESDVIDDKKAMQSIDIEAMIASLSSDGPVDTTV